jgi:hypothetical protein
MNNTKKTFKTDNSKPEIEIIESLKSLARSYQTNFSHDLNSHVEWVLN